MRLFRRATFTGSRKSPRMDRARGRWLAFFWISYWTGLPIFSIRPLLPEVCANPAVQNHPDKISAYEMTAPDDKNWKTSIAWPSVLVLS
jgi:hypothetical protein